ncbi:MAG: hypothetical protein ACHWZW_20190 [Spirulina sp.]
MTKTSKYNFSKAEKVQIFEQVDTYIEAQHNYATDPSVQATIMDLKALITHLQSQHPTVANESEALAIIDAEFTEVQHSSSSKWANLRQQLINPKRHLQATKATLIEIAQHYLEESIWGKATITYLDTLSQPPEKGA